VPQLLELKDDNFDEEQIDFEEQAAFFTLKNLNIGEILSV